MLRLLISGYSVKLAVILIFILTASCVNLKTIPPNNIIDLQPTRKFLRIHSEDSLWVIDRYQVKGMVLSGKLVKNPASVPNFKRADIYIASSKAVKIEGDLLTLATENIGKVDYEVVNGLFILESISLLIVLIFFVPIFFN